MAKSAPLKTRTQVLEDITTFMKRHAAPMEHWYVGTATDARAQLFKGHGFKESDTGLYRKTASNSDASSLAALLIKRGAKGDAAVKPGADSIYVFRLTAHTNPAFGN